MSDETKYGYRGIFYIMEVLKNLTSQPFTKQTISKVLHKGLLDLWMNQLVVLNKNCRDVAENITLNINEDSEVAFEVLQFLHENKVVIGNIQKKHPLQPLYKTVDPSKFLKYLLGRIDNEYNEDELCEAYAFVRLTAKEVPSKLVVKIMKKLL